MKDAFLFGQGRGAARSSFLLLTLDRPVLYTGTLVRDYRSNRNVFFACHYHAVWCPKYRRKVLVGPIEARLKQIIAEVCQEHQADIEELEVLPDHVHLLVSVDPQYGIHRLMKLIKGRSSRLLRQEFLELKRKLPSLWTNSYFVSTTGGAPLSIIKQYIEQQKYV